MRNQYLKEEWAEYPAAPVGCRSLHQFLREIKSNLAGVKTSGWVGGRILWSNPQKLEGGIFLLSAFDQMIECEWQLPFILVGQKSSSENGRKIDQAKAMSQESLSDFFRYGDQIAVKVEEVLKRNSSDDEVEIKLKISEVMMLAPAITEPKLKNFSTQKKWKEFLNDVRSFFEGEGLKEISTSTLVKCPGLEPTLEPFQTTWKVGTKEEILFLPTSPEIQIKKKICQGASDVFEIKSCFRNEEESTHHLPEFHMIEWYRGYSRLDAIENDVANLVKFLVNKKSENSGSPNEESISIQRRSIAELVKKYLNFELTPKTTKEELQDLADEKGISTSEKDSWNDVFHRLWIELVEPKLINEGPLIVHSYPPSQAALARTGEEGWIERFEFYWQGFEIANAFHEVNDPHLQKQRWQQEMDERTHLQTTKLEADDELIVFQHTGMPPTSGIALGLERLFMAIHSVDDIFRIWR